MADLLWTSLLENQMKLNPSIFFFLLNCERLDKWNHQTVARFLNNSYEYTMAGLSSEVSLDVGSRS